MQNAGPFGCFVLDRIEAITRITDAQGTVLRDNADFRDVWASRAERIDRLVREADSTSEPAILAIAFSSLMP